MDRFHEKNTIILGNKKVVMLASAYGDDDELWKR